MNRTYTVSKPSYTGLSFIERLFTWLFYTRWQKLYRRVCQWQHNQQQNADKQIPYEERRYLWQEADALGRKLDKTTFQIIAIERNRFGGIRARIQNMAFPDIVWDVKAHLWSDMTQAFDYEAGVGSLINATYRYEMWESSWHQHAKHRPLALNCVTLRLDRTPITSAIEEIERECGHMQIEQPQALDLQV